MRLLLSVGLKQIQTLLLLLLVMLLTTLHLIPNRNIIVISVVL
nr:MAG TPA: hypothetical protein [Caudoviricetes sp.]